MAYGFVSQGVDIACHPTINLYVGQDEWKKLKSGSNLTQKKALYSIGVAGRV